MFCQEFCSTLDHSHVSFAVMTDRKRKAVNPIKKLTKKEKEELKKNVSGSCSSDKGFFCVFCDALCPALCTSHAQSTDILKKNNYFFPTVVYLFSSGKLMRKKNIDLLGPPYHQLNNRI